jgi:hypothetical protein
MVLEDVEEREVEEREDEELDVLKTVLELEEELDIELIEDKEDELDERSASSYVFLKNTSPFDIVIQAPTV